jgi:hypothetical protein
MEICRLAKGADSMATCDLCEALALFGLIESVHRNDTRDSR